MKRTYCLFFAFYFLLFSFLGCGGGPGSPGSDGSEKTGINPRVVTVTHSDPNGDQGDLWEIDFVQDLCADGVTVETFGSDYAHISFFGDLLNPNVTSTNVLYITNYKVTFFKDNPSYPTISQVSGGLEGGYTIQPNTDSGPYNFLILDPGTKRQIYDDLVSGQYNPLTTPLIYDMKIEIEGEDKYGNAFKVGPIIRRLTIADYLHC